MKFTEAMKRYKRQLAAALAVTLGLGCYYPVQASKVSDKTETKQNVQNKKEDAENKRDEAAENLDSINQEIEDIQGVQSGLYEEMETYDQELITLLTDMDLLKQDISNKEDDIAQAAEDLEQAKEEEQTQYEAMKVRIQYMYENGNQDFWTALIGSKSITELLNRAEYASEVYNYDRKLLEEYQDAVAQVEELQEQYASELSEMEELQISFEEQQTELEGMIAKKRAQIADFDTQLANAKTLAAQYAQTVRKQNQIIAKQETKLAQIAEEERQAKLEEERRKAEAQQNTETGSTEAGSTESSNTETGSTESGGSSTSDGTGSSGSTSNGSGSSGSSSDSNSGGNGLTNSDLDPGYATNVSGTEVVNYASKFVGNPYVYGGNSLTEGTDCSGFVNLVYAHFGISVPRDSYSLRSAGKTVSYENAKAGDIICYAGHVAIYMGNGKIVHASTPSTGIKYGTATYRTILSVRRVL
jgi:cell wall-associated hydrolases (invasion-associated proteins)|uniref:C40 family peptidase n=1 Tax=Roseburia sp. TaxID=2049040 RepID=UPI003FEFBB43